MSQRIENVLREDRSFPPSDEFRAKSRLGSQADYEALHAESIQDPEGFFGRIARELPWIQSFDSVLDWSEAPRARWFGGGKLNASAVCLDQHLAKAGDQVAIRWEGEPGDTRNLTYAQLHAEVCRMANGLRARGLKKGDRVAIYLPMIPEVAVAVLACARLGLIHSVVFAGFSAQALRDRIEDGGCTAVITSDGGWRRGKVLPLKQEVDAGLEGQDQVHTVVVVRRTENEVAWDAGRDVWYHELVSDQPATCEPEPMDAEDTLFLLYTSGSTGKPKGIMHTTGGYMVGAYLSTRYVFDLQPGDVYWCTADVGWITGHSYIVYGPLANGATQVMYEGAPNAPAENRFWDIVERHGVTVFYTAPTAIRAFMKWGDEHVTRHDLSSLRLLGTVGEPINPEAWRFYYERFGHRQTSIVDTYWQTETGGHMLTGLPGCTPMKPGAAGLPFFGIEPQLMDVESGAPLAKDGVTGILCVAQPWPGVARTVYGDHQRYLNTDAD